MDDVTMLDIQGLDKAALLAALYNGAAPRGLGWLHYDPAPLTQEQAAAYIAEKRARLLAIGTQRANDAARVERFVWDVDYLQGRPLKVNLCEDTFDPRWYDRANGYGTAAAIVQTLRQQPAPGPTTGAGEG